jgi:NAD(P)H-hydrate epimerase
MTLPNDVHRAATVHQLEQAAIASGTAGYTLMRRAGAAALAHVRQRWPTARSMVVVAGPGNNGGDGLVLAQLARDAGIFTHAMLVGDAAALRGEAQQALQDLRTAGMDVQPFDASLLDSHDLIIDALLGIGVRAPLKPEWRAAIDAMNAAGRNILSLDVPSGLEPDTGRALPAVHATATLSFLALKLGLFLGEGPEHAGAVLFDGLGVTAAAPSQPALQRLDHGCLNAVLPPRARQSHKSMFGRVLIVGGGVGMPGAVRLAAESALRVGAGLVTVASRPEHLATVVGPRPELMFHGVCDASDVDAVLAQADVIAVGPGLGRSDWARALLQHVLRQRQGGQRLVVDADALNLIAEGVALQRCADWVLTPHPGEAARLLGISTEAVQEDRLAALSALCKQRGGTIVLKGAATLIRQTGSIPLLCEKGNPGMAVPGMGDVLTGALTGLLAQGAEPFAAAAAAVYAHAVAGDRCARNGVRGVLALDVARELRAVLALLP